MSGDSGNRTPETKSCPRCGGRGRIEPFWPVGPGGARLEDHKCSTCGGTGIFTISPPVMNSPADEAEARDRAHGAPRQADPAAPGRSESGLTSGSEARPVTPTAHHLSSNVQSLLEDLRNDDRVSMQHTAWLEERAVTEIERLTRERDEARQMAGHLRKAHENISHLRSALEKLLAGPPTYRPFGYGGGEWVQDVCREALSGDPSPDETTTQPVVYQTCSKHAGMTFEMMVSATPYQFRTVCPICEPPTWYCRCGAANTTARCSNCELTAAEGEEIERRRHMIFPVGPSVCKHEKARITCDDCGIDLRGATLEQPSKADAAR